MKKIFPLIFLLFSVLTFSQQKQFKIDWEGSKVLSTSSFKIEIPAFNEANFNYNPDSGLQFISQWESSRFVNEKSATITNVNYANIFKSELKDIDLKTIPTILKYKFSNSTSRGKNYLYLELSPIIKDGDQYKKIISFTINYQFLSNSANRNITSIQEITSSVLSTGNWYRFYVDKTGVFKLSKSFLASLGANLNNVDPRTIKIYGNGGAMLPFSNSEFYPFDLQENAIKFIGEEDGIFNDDDFIMFYAEGPIGFNQQSNTNINIYTDKSYYYLNIGEGLGKRINTFLQPVGTPDLIIDTFHDYQFHEVDELNIAKIGRRWFGDRFDIEVTKSFDFEIPNLISTEPIRFKVYAAAVAESNTSMQVNVNGSAIGSLNFSPINSQALASEDWIDSFINVSSSNINVSLDYNNNGNPSALAYLDYVSVEAKRSLTYDDEQFVFKNYDVALSSGIVQYNISNSSNITEIWEITDKYNVTNFINDGSSSTLSFTSALGSLKTYLAFNTSDYFEPLKDISSVSNQDIKGTIFQNDQGQFQDVDYIIVAPQEFLSQAERLAEINRKQYKLNVKVVQLDKIYNEFSSGNQDVSAIKNLVRYVYDNASSPENQIKYLCLFGDASFDYKDRISGNTNFVPAWHAYSSFNLTNSFVSDDFYGMMDATEGELNNSDKLDVAVGRILADSPQRAKELVDKIESYYQPESFGSWRNNFVVVSDDVDQSWEKILQETTNAIADSVVQEKPFINATKIHSDSYQQESSAGGERYPEATTALSDAMELGALVVNYFGHGGEDGLAQERIFFKTDVQNLRNVCKLNCFVTVTCEYTKFDNPLRETAGELTYWNKNGGAISLITTTRQIFVSTGIVFNNTLSQYLFSFGSYDIPSMAEALRLTKTDPNISSTAQRRLVFFIGDPAMKLAFAKPNIKLTQINDVPITQAADTLKALSKVKLSGEVTDAAGITMTDYNGILSTTIYDKEIDRQTLGNDRVSENGQLIILDFKTLGEIIFRGQATVSNGLFDFDFIVPRDISIPVGNGKVSFYAKTDNSLQDNAGANFDIEVGGLNENAPEDNIGPTIKLFMNDESFVSGGITNEEPSLLALLEDENGINTASGIGHDIVAIIDNDETNPFVLNDYYETDVDVYQTGKVNFPFRDLEPGLHTLTLKAWDVYNNSSTAEIQFIVFDKDETLKIENVLNYPNPFINYTEFWFNHNSSDTLDVSIQIFTVSGKLVRTINGNTSDSELCMDGTSSLSRSIVWDGRDDFGDKIGKGVYVYKLTVHSNALNKKVEKFEKLVIL